MFNDGIEQCEYNAKLLLSDKENDVALIQITDSIFQLSNTPYGFNINAEVGTDVFTIGFPRPGTMGENYKVTNGIISSSSGVEDDVRVYQISVPVQPGNSGGPLFDNNGNVVGIVTSMLSEDYVNAKVENVNYAVKISYLLNLYQMLNHPSTLTITAEQLPQLSDKVKKYRNYVCMVKVYQ